jgi:multisubunit Na+/H+ antiporter MnhB subunit
MSKVTRKLRPSDYWRIGEHESWFEDMANEGLHLKRMGLHFAQFNRGEPRKIRYRIDVSSNKGITLEQKQMYAESGWDYVTSYGDFNVFSSPVHRNAPELHTDPAEQAYTMKELDKKLVFNALMVVVSVIIMVGVVSAIWFMEDTPVLALVEGIIISEIISTVIMIYLAYTSLQATISIRNLQKTLLDGKPINHNAPWKKNQRVKCSIAVIYVLIAISASVLPFIQLAKKETRTLPLVNNDLPIVRLADVEKNSKLVRKISLYNKEDIDWGNKYSYDWSLLAPIQYDSDEHGIISNEMWKDDSGEYSPSIHTNVYKLNFSFMTDNLIYDLIKKYNIENKDFLELDNTSLDKLIVQEEDELKQIFASKGQSVMYIRYYGYADLDLVVKATEEKILLVSE